MERADELVAAWLLERALERVGGRGRLRMELLDPTRRGLELDVVDVAGLGGPAPDDLRPRLHRELGREVVVVVDLDRARLRRSGRGRRRDERGAGEGEDGSGLHFL